MSVCLQTKGSFRFLRNITFWLACFDLEKVLVTWQSELLIPLLFEINECEKMSLIFLFRLPSYLVIEPIFLSLKMPREVVNPVFAFQCQQTTPKLLVSAISLLPAQAKTCVLFQQHYWSLFKSAAIKSCPEKISNSIISDNFYMFSLIVSKLEGSSLESQK